ncbi:hypothetical protein J3R83DRAFT_10202 [Lanmaoa asiatica]|nr:hypothetical protein J3R83DRAFT_10202 [Lanmaoa asiatica]
MVKGLKTSYKKWKKLFKENEGWEKILSSLATASPGTRAWPNQTKDRIVSFRVDYGPFYTGPDGNPQRDLVLQANKGAKNPSVAAIAKANPHQVLARITVPADCPPTEDEFANCTRCKVGFFIVFASFRLVPMSICSKGSALDGETLVIRNAVASAKDSEYDQVFRYTSGRWIYNERERERLFLLQTLLIRKLCRNAYQICVLQRRCPQAKLPQRAAGAECCVQMVKTAEGSFNKIFLLTFDNGKKLIAKIPCPVVVPRRLCTASEVATMDYARNILSLPVPRILSWSANADASEVGTEVWKLYKRMHNFRREATHFVDQLVDVECKFVRYRFSQIGSLYYKEDVSPELQQRPLYAEGEEGGGSDRFRIGPCVEWDIWRGKRRPDTLSYIKAIVDIEKQWLSTFAVPRKSRDPFRRPDSENAPDAHIRLLDNFLAVIPRILPPDELCAPVLWHIDLHAGQHWQGISVRPLFLQATFAACVRYEGDDRITIPPGMAAPILPPDFDSCSEEDKEYLKGQERLAIIHKYYETRVMQRNPLYFASQTYSHMKYIVPPILGASRTWYEGMHNLRQVLLELQDAWEDIAPGTPFPFKWDTNEIVKHREAYLRLMEYEERIEKVVEGLQLEGDGWVTNERYNEVTRRSKDIIKNWNPKKLGGPYPFQEGGRSWFLS